MIPIEIGTPEQFAILRTCLDEAGYTAAKVCARLGVPSLYRFKQLREGRTQGAELNDPLDVLIRLFMDVEMVEGEKLRALLPEEAIATLGSLGLLARSQSHADRYQPTVLLYPAGTAADLGAGFPELYAVSDLTADPDPAFPATLQPDAVYAAITQNTGAFLTFLPRKPCDRFLELCSGTGIAAQLASRFAGRAWAIDVTDRATRFAEFARRLNQVSNVEVLCGDMYQPVSGLTFDRIAAHPPYVPASEQRIIFRDGGDDGEQLTTRVIAELPRYLTPGGRLYCVCRATDRKGARLEQRVRGLLGPTQGEFDVLVVALSEDEPSALYHREIETGRLTHAEADARIDLFRRLEVELSVYSLIVVQRAAQPRPVFTERRDLGSGASSAAVEWLLDWETSVRTPGQDRRLLDARPRVPELADLQLQYRRRDGAWKTTGCSILTTWPFAIRVQSPAWAASMLQHCDGRTTFRDHLSHLADAKGIAQPGSEEAFLGGVRMLVSAGVLELEDHPLPPRMIERPVEQVAVLVPAVPAPASVPAPPIGNDKARVDDRAPRIGTPEDFGLVAGCLRRAGYDEARLSARVGIARVYDFRTLRDGRAQSPEITDPLDLLIRLFMDIERVKWAEVRGHVTPAEVSAFQALDLIESAPSNPDLCQATVLLYPTEGLHLVSDLHASPDPDANPVLREDAVYPAITRNAGHFLAALPTTPCDTMLELCAGTGIAALMQSRRCRQVWATDLTERSTHFARFNGLLNSVDNLTAVCGDLYAPVAGLTFDRIVAHPPYVASTERRMIYRDGGIDGEDVVRRIVEGIPAFLRPGGHFYGTCVVSDRKGAPVEARLRTLLGSAAEQFDVVVFVRSEQSPDGVLAHRAGVGGINADEMRALLGTLESLGVERFVYCSFVIRRARAPRPVFTVRRSLPEHASAEIAEWMLDWEEAMSRPGAEEALWAERLQAAPGAAYQLTHRRQAPGWTTGDCTILGEWPFQVRIHCPPAAAELLLLSDGQVTVREQLSDLRERGLVGTEVTDGDFLGLVRQLAACAVLTLGEFPVPRRPAVS